MLVLLSLGLLSSSLGVRKTPILTDDILLDGKIYRPVGEYQDGGDDRSNPFQWMLGLVKELWSGKKAKKHHGASKHKQKTFKFQAQFRPLRGGGEAEYPQLTSSQPVYRPRFTFKSSEEKYFLRFQSKNIT